MTPATSQLDWTEDGQPRSALFGDVYFSALIELGLILFLITTVVLAASKLLLMQLAKGEGART